MQAWIRVEKPNHASNHAPPLGFHKRTHAICDALNLFLLKRARDDKDTKAKAKTSNPTTVKAKAKVKTKAVKKSGD